MEVQNQRSTSAWEIQGQHTIELVITDTQVRCESKDNDTEESEEEFNECEHGNKKRVDCIQKRR